MLSFLKTCGRGFIVIISSPLWLLFFALYIVYGLILFIYMAIKAIVKLFSKNHLTIETEYDRKAKIILSNPSFDFRYGTTNRQDIYPQQHFYQPQFQPTYQPQPQQAPQYNNPQQPMQSNFNQYNNVQPNNQFGNFNNQPVNNSNYQPQQMPQNQNPQGQYDNQQYNNNYNQNNFNNNNGQFGPNNNERNE